MIGNVIAGMFAGGAAAGDFESIATVTVGSGGSYPITFSSIPSTYQHLQIRFLAQSETVNNSDYFKIRFNGNTTTTNYRSHALSGDGSGVYAETSANDLQFGALSGTGTLNVFSGGIIDILDYTNTNKYTTIRALGGHNKNSTTTTTQWIGLASGLFMLTDVISSITLNSGTGSDFSQYSHFALYGIKG